MAIIDVHTPFTLMDDDHKAHRFEAGGQEVSNFVASHWWTKLFAEVEDVTEDKDDDHSEDDRENESSGNADDSSDDYDQSDDYHDDGDSKK
ncbi:STY1053 family phage-associated protein [Solilutibacter silvestris]|uniref:STY1053 family phage-associated protein n=1 Tax=Solilutibacter silvestris TaxID=1645665 RepID=UPI003D359AE3